MNMPITVPTTDTTSATLTTFRAPKRSIRTPPNSAMTSADAENAVIRSPCMVYERPNDSIIDGCDGGTFPY